MTGRRPKPTAVKRREGNPGRRKLNRHEAQPDPEIPEMPQHLDAAARAEWERITPQLLQQGLITVIDRTALASYCAAFSRWAKAERKLQQLGLVVTSANGNLLQSPWVGIASKAQEHMRKLAVEFGMTPAARSRVAVNPKVNPDADLRTLLSGPALTDQEKQKLQ